MMTEEQLFEALKYINSLRQVVSFRNAVADWRGPIKLSFGAHSTEISPWVHSQVMNALRVEEIQLRHLLEKLGVESSVKDTT